MARKVPKDLTEALEIIATMEGEITAANTRATNAETAAQNAVADVARIRTEHEIGMALIEKGVTDPDDRDAILARYDRMPADDRPAFADWFKKSAPKDRIVQRILADVEAAKAPAGDTKAADSPEAPAAGKGAADDTKAAAKAPEVPGVPAGKAAPAPAPKGGWTNERLQNASVKQLRDNLEQIRREAGYGESENS